MHSRPDVEGSKIESGNVPGNPLSSYRMSMLTHGFVLDSDTGDEQWVAGDDSPMTYGVVRSAHAPLAVAIVIAVLLVLLVAAAVIIT